MVNQIVIYAAQGAMGLAALLLIGILIERLSQQVRERRLAQGVALVQPLLFQYIFEELSLARLAAATTSQRPALKHLLLLLLPQLDGTVRQRLRKVAEEFGFVRQAVRAALHGNPALAELGAMRLGLWRSEAGVPALVRLLRSRNREVRYTAARSLALIGSTEVMRVLLDLLRRPDLVDTPRVLEIVQQMQRPEIAPFEDVLQDEDFELESRLMLIDLLGDWREHRIIPVLRELLWHHNVEIVLRSMKALIRIGDIDGLPVMLSLIDHHRWEVRAQVVKAVGTLGFTDALPLMEAALADRSYWVRRNAAITLAVLGGEALALLDPEAHDDRFAQDMARYQRQRVGLNGYHPDPVIVIDSPERLALAGIGEAV